MENILEIDNKKTNIQSLEELMLLLDDISGRQRVELTLCQYLGSIEGLRKSPYKMLGLSTDKEGESVYTLKKNDKCAIVFLDMDGGEFRPINKDYAAGSDKQIEFVLANGSKSIHSLDECHPFDVAAEAVISFYRHGKRPDWFEYRHTK